MKGHWELRTSRDPKTKKQVVSFGTWGATEGTHLVYPTEKDLVEMATSLLNAAAEMRKDRKR